MATPPAGLYSTYGVAGANPPQGEKEDVSDLIFNISPTETPCLSMIGTTDAGQILHQWQTDALRTPAANIQIEGDDLPLGTPSATAPTTMEQNYCQISAEVFGVSGTLEVTKKWGRDSELAYQAAKSARQLKTDVDFTLTGTDQISAVGTYHTARSSGALTSWIETNCITSGTAGSDGDTALTRGTTRPFTQALLDEGIQSAWNNGGSPSVILAGPYQKMNLSYFDGVGGDKGAAGVTRSDRGGRTIYATADLYVSNFGELRVVPSRHMNIVATFDADVMVLDPEYLKIAYLRPWQQFDLAKSGDSIKREMLVEWTLEVCNEAAHALIADLNNTNPT